MKKTILFLIMCMLGLSTFASAFVQYTGAPTTPYLVFGTVNWNDQLLSGTRVQITNTNTGYSMITITSSDGYWQVDSTDFLTNNAGRPPVMYGDIIKVKAMDGCGTSDVCEKSFSALSGTSMYEYQVAARVDLSLSGTLTCPPVSCPSYSCSGGSSSSSCSYTETKCNELYPNEEVICTPTVCPEQVVCEVCKDSEQVVCDDSVIKEDCVNQCVEESNLGLILAGLLAGLGIGGVGTYWFASKKYFFKRTDGIIPDGTFIKMSNGKIVHLHQGLVSYHDPYTSHQDKLERHPKGQLDPEYQKDASGKYVFKG